MNKWKVIKVEAKVNLNLLKWRKKKTMTHHPILLLLFKGIINLLLVNKQLVNKWCVRKFNKIILSISNSHNMMIKFVNKWSLEKSVKLLKLWSQKNVMLLWDNSIYNRKGYKISSIGKLELKWSNKNYIKCNNNNSNKMKRWKNYQINLVNNNNKIIILMKKKKKLILSNNNL